MVRHGVRLNQRVLDWCSSRLSFQRVSANAIIIIPITRSALNTLDHRTRLCGILQVMGAGVLITRTRIEIFAPNHVADLACVYTLDSRSLGLQSDLDMVSDAVYCNECHSRCAGGLTLLASTLPRSGPNPMR